MEFFTVLVAVVGCLSGAFSLYAAWCVVYQIFHQKSEAAVPFGKLLLWVIVAVEVAIAVTTILVTSQGMHALPPVAWLVAALAVLLVAHGVYQRLLRRKGRSTAD